MDNNQDNKRLVDECMDKLKAQKKELDGCVMWLEKWEDKYTIFTEEELGCPFCRVQRLVKTYEIIDDERKKAMLENKALKEKIEKLDNTNWTEVETWMKSSVASELETKALKDKIEELKNEIEELKKDNNYEELKKENKKLRKVVGWSSS